MTGGQGGSHEKEDNPSDTQRGSRCPVPGRTEPPRPVAAVRAVDRGTDQGKGTPVINLNRIAMVVHVVGW